MAINYTEVIAPCLEIVFFFPEVNIRMWRPIASGVWSVLYISWFVAGFWQDWLWEVREVLVMFIYVYMRNRLISQTIPCCKERPEIVIFNIYGRVMLPMEGDASYSPTLIYLLLLKHRKYSTGHLRLSWIRLETYLGQEGLELIDQYNRDMQYLAV